MSRIERGIPAASRPSKRVEIIGIAVLVALFVVGLWWAKWLPYAETIDRLTRTRTWDGPASFTASGSPGTDPTVLAAWEFTDAYFQAVWKAALVALLLAAAIDALVPRVRLVALLNRRSRASQSLVGGLCSLPSLMCTCCTAPVAVGLRWRGAALAAGLAYWVGNPVLNPAVLVCLFLVAPWQFGAVRVIVGAALVFGATALVAKLFGSGADPQIPAVSTVAAGSDPVRVSDLPGRYLRSLVRHALVLVPDYFAVIFVLGLVSGRLSDFSSLDARLGILAVVMCALIGTLLVIPTGGEIPVVLALTAAGVGAAPAGALLVTLPALSIPSMVMVARAFTWRVTVAMAGATALAGVVSAALLIVLS